MIRHTDEASSAALSASSFADISREVSSSTILGVQKILSSIRLHLDMDVAFVSEFVGEKRYFRHVDARSTAPIRIGDSMPLSEGYCQRVIDGSLPELIADTSANPLAASLPETRAVPIGSHLSVPIRLKSGRVYGTFCCFNFLTHPSLDQGDLNMMRAFADIAAHQIDHELAASATRTEQSERILAAIKLDQPEAVYQPLVSLGDHRVVGVECLARFANEPQRGPDRWFAEAADIGYGTILELQAIRNALRGLQGIALGDHVQIWLNLSARTILDGDVARHFEPFAPSRIVLELTEHEHVDDYGALNRALEPLRAEGVRVAIDDAGAGYASMSHILNLSPDLIKLDLSLTRRIDVDQKRRALAAALIEFGKQTGARIVAEGVESVEELNALRRLGVHMAQGYYVSRPVGSAALAGVLAAFDEPRRD